MFAVHYGLQYFVFFRDSEFHRNDDFQDIVLTVSSTRQKLEGYTGVQKVLDLNIIGVYVTCFFIGLLHFYKAMNVKIEILARHIDLPVDTLDRWIRQGRIPINKIGDNCVFNENTLAKWAAAHDIRFDISGLNTSGKDKKTREIKNEEPLVYAMQRGGVLHDIEGKDVSAVIRSAVDRFSFLSPEDRESLYGQLIDRENLMSTGIGNGVAIPHPRTPMADIINAATIITCFLKHPVDFHAVDDQPVFIMFIMLSHSTKTHLHLLSRLTFILRNNSFIGFLRQMPKQELFLDEIARLEQQLGFIKI